MLTRRYLLEVVLSTDLAMFEVPTDLGMAKMAQRRLSLKDMDDPNVTVTVTPYDQSRTKAMVTAAIALAADVMDAVDPDDRSQTDKDLIFEVKTWIELANDGDLEKRELLFEAVPSWRPSPVIETGVVG